MSPIRSFWFLILVTVLAGIMSLTGTILRVAHAAPASVSTVSYGPEDDYILVKDCPHRVCDAPATWQPGEQLLHTLFLQQGWGQDSAVGSRLDAHRLTWGQWAADHLYYVDEASPAARREALNTVLHDPHGRSIHIVPVPSVR